MMRSSVLWKLVPIRYNPLCSFAYLIRPPAAGVTDSANNEPGGHAHGLGLEVAHFGPSGSSRQWVTPERKIKP